MAWMRANRHPRGVPGSRRGARRPRRLAPAVVAVLVAFAGAAALAADEVAGAAPDLPEPWLEIGASASTWLLLREQVETGLVQPGSGDPADDEASGFNFKQGRLTLQFHDPRNRLTGLLRLRLEERADLLDLWGSYRVGPALSVALGQMKIPATAEVLTPDEEGDFVIRSTFGSRLGDYALTRTPYISSIMAAKSYDRDLGLALRGGLFDDESTRPRLSYFLMVANGLGGNRYIGGSGDEFLYTNGVGDLYYGLRLEGSPADGAVVGLHGSINHHDDVALDDRGPVFDIDRRVWTADLTLRRENLGRLYGFYGDGRMEDYWTSTAYRYDFSGWGLWAIWELRPASLEIGLRYDTMTTEFQQDGNTTEERHWTFGANWRPQPRVRLQLDYVAKETVAVRDPDLRDDLFCLNVQLLFGHLPADRPASD